MKITTKVMKNNIYGTNNIRSNKFYFKGSITGYYTTIRQTL